MLLHWTGATAGRQTETGSTHGASFKHSLIELVPAKIPKTPGLYARNRP